MRRANFRSNMKEDRERERAITSDMRDLCVRVREQNPSPPPVNKWMQHQQRVQPHSCSEGRKDGCHGEDRRRVYLSSGR